MQRRKVRIAGVGKYLPQTVITAEEMDERIGVPIGWVEKKSGVIRRHFVNGETNSQMGAYAAREALEMAGLHLSDMDCIVCASGTSEQAIPCTASLIYKELDPGHQGIPAFDINSTCLSFVTAFDHLSYLVDAGRYRYVLLVSSEIASIGLNWNHKESCALFGDGAAAVIIGPAEDGASGILSSHMETYSQGAHLSQIRGGGTKYHPRTYAENIDPDHFLFEMDGEALFRMSARYLPRFMKQLLPKDLTMKEINLVIPHQASMMAMRIMQKRLKISAEQMFIFAQNHGNTIAASIPMGIYEAVKQGRVKRGDKVMLIGTSAGLSLGGIILVY
ncbi:beta-ketoacyl-ACP synthase III [Paenactinomyces guangxiensis]|uniref:Beta-ketoacyl-ACP synthase III n=1 Tax=Paenactinomyces guangxiensis TaxID=1490290 RepID=A0A7W2A7C4_9BACL|nr:beta-ketoacyl-ACP synthase III [Paenactinomyces guangxiensis]MBA4493400.1 beta-ketoacyl-ACP synthase III [Paenactinomyces guangxiensis]MBH8590490.1 beta-ketoacyl-ACP synthase III [Paenactinomyces guangxiensis]